MGMSLTDLWEIFIHSCFLDRDDPIEGWESIHQFNDRVENVLKNTDKIRIIAEKTDLTMSIKGRLFDNCYGQVNIPDGEVATAPIEDSVNGHILFTYPFFNDGKEIDRINLIFENGKAVKATADTNEKYLNKMLDVDEGARYLGEIGFGTNFNIPKFMGNLFFDEKLGGTLHLALGNAYPAEGGKNVSTIHWDIVLDLRNGAEVYTDGNLFIKDGEYIFDE
jgi:aminopeptidase